MIYKSRYVLTINLSEIGMWEEGLRALPEDFQKVHLNGQLGDENTLKIHSSFDFALLGQTEGTLNDCRACNHRDTVSSRTLRNTCGSSARIFFSDMVDDCDRTIGKSSQSTADADTRKR